MFTGSESRRSSASGRTSWRAVRSSRAISSAARAWSRPQPGSARERLHRPLDGHAVVGLEGRGLPVAARAVGVLQPEQHHLAGGHHCVGGHERPPQRNREAQQGPLHDSRTPAASSSEYTPSSRPVAARAPFRAGPSVRVRTVRIERRGKGPGQRGEREPPGQPARGGHGQGHGEGHHQHRHEEHPRTLAPELHRQRALARPPVGVRVAHVVHHQDRRGQEPHRAPRGRRPPR